MDFFLLAECTWRLRTSGKTKGHLIQTGKKKSGLYLSLSSPVPGCLSPCQMPDARAHCGWGLSCPSPEPHSLSPPGPSPPLPILPGESKMGLPSSRLLPRLVLRLRCWVSAPVPAFSRPSSHSGLILPLPKQGQSTGRQLPAQRPHPCSGLHQSRLDPFSTHARPDGPLSSLNYFQKGSSVPELGNQETPGGADPAHVGQKVGGSCQTWEESVCGRKGAEKGHRGPTDVTEFWVSLQG